MTRLITEWLTPIEEGMSTWDKKLYSLTGFSLAELAARAAGACADPAGDPAFANPAAGKHAAVVSITSGEGVIGSFAASIAAILQTIGMDAFVTEETDVAGIYEAANRNADVVFMADDERYIALNLRNGRIGENDLATALGYRQVLEECSRKQTGEGIGGQPVLLMGYGRVGRIMYELLRKKGAIVTVYDKDPARQGELRKAGIRQLADPSGIAEYHLVADLTSEGDWIDPAWLRDDLIMAAPGVPLSVRAEDLTGLAGTVIHDDLEIGTAVMAMIALQEGKK